jgi:hypothetical protein
MITFQHACHPKVNQTIKTMAYKKGKKRAKKSQDCEVTQNKAK